MGKEKSVPIENIRAIIVAARGITFTSQLLSELAVHNCVVLHCDDKYRPAATTMPLPRIINQRILSGQTMEHGHLRSLCWQKVVAQKIRNQSAVLDFLSLQQNPLLPLIDDGVFDEALAARLYFNRYFKVLGAATQNRANRSQGWLNALLNYGYTVLCSLVHRAVVVHGLLPHFGIHHKPRYGTWPLVYDLMEPFRPLVDVHVWHFLKHNKVTGDDVPMASFGRYLGLALRDFRLPYKNYTLKLIDAVDYMARSFAYACEEKNHHNLWLPTFCSTELKQLTVQILKDQ